MKIVIIGAGAMGCLYGAYLSRHNEVIMLDSYQPQVDAINKNGITVIEENGTEQHFSSVRACLSGEYKEDADLVIVFVKSTYTEDALKTNRKLFGEHTLVMTLQNGAGNDRKIEQYVVKKNIIIGTSKIPRVMVIYHGTNRRTCNCCESIDRQVYKKLTPYDTLNIIRNFCHKSTFLKQI